MYFKNLQLKEWQQFKDIDIDFHERLTILTGANASGKTTILNLLSKHCGWDIQQLSTPKAEGKKGIFRRIYRLFNGEDKSDEKRIGTLTYSDDDMVSLLVPEGESPQYSIKLSNQKAVDSFYIPSHGSIFRYQRLESIPTQKRNKKQAFNEVLNQYRSRYLGSGGPPVSFPMKTTIVGWLIQGYGVRDNEKYLLPKDDEQIEYYEGFQKVLKKLLPTTLGFQEFEVRDMDIVFVCNEGKDEFVFETASGGVAALIDIAWQIYTFSIGEREDFTVLIDEIENHLHPSMQRKVLPDLLDAFPKARFIVATHNPLIVGSVKDCSIYALKYNENYKIESEPLDFQKKPKTASEILDQVLGVSFTMPIWVEDYLKRIVEKYVKRAMNEGDFDEMRRELADIGLERLMPKAIEEVIRGKND